MRRRKETRLAQVSLALTGLVAALAVPGSGSADPAARADALGTQQASLGTRSHAALLSLYSIDARLTQSHALAASLTAQADDVRTKLAEVAREREIARHAWRASVAALGAHLRTLYEEGQPDALAVLLGSTSIDDAMTRIDDLRRSAQVNRQTIAQTRRARTTLAGLQVQLENRARRLRTLVAAAARTIAQLEQARTDRALYLTSLMRERQFTARKVAQLDARARASAARPPESGSEQTASAPIAAVATTPATPAVPATAGSLTVTATGYSLAGQTATGLPAGWGVVAVDPSVIPLGTRLTIPGYGEGVAADTGPAVHGAAIDLWFPTPAQALAWGRRTVTIAVH